MNIYILCGGIGNRLNNYSLPKPLNMINGKPSIYYTLKDIPEYIKNINFIIGYHLKKYNFEKIIRELFNNRFNYNFYYLPYKTRGAIESGLLGLNNITVEGKILFMDNDIIYKFPDNFEEIINEIETGFIGYSIDKTETNKYSFIKKDEENNIIEIQEKNKISDYYCCGIYGFKNIEEFKKYGIEIMNENNNREKYLSYIYDKIIKDGIKIKAIEFPTNNKHIGTYNEINEYKSDIINKICFDYEDIINNKELQELMKKLKEKGNYIILKMRNNIKLNNIEYDEIIYDDREINIYINTKSINPYYNKMEIMGLFNCEIEINRPLNKLNNNIFNEIILENNIIIKKSLNETLEGENYYYKNIPKDLIKYYPKYINYNDNKLYIENINGIPLYTLYKWKMLKKEDIKLLFSVIRTIHEYKYKIEITKEDIYNNYIKKLKDRFNEKENYDFEDAEIIQTYILNKLEEYLDDYDERNICGIIHGDLWFSNILLDYDNNIKLIDMKGKIYNKLTLNGDIYYDYGKLYQSILGYDNVLYNDKIDEEYKKEIQEYFEKIVIDIGIDIKKLKIITFGLVIGTLKYINKENRKRIWEWMKSTFIPERNDV